MKEAFKGGTLIIDVSMNFNDEEYFFQNNDIVEISIKDSRYLDNNILYDSLTINQSNEGENEVQFIFSSEDTEVLDFDTNYEILAQLTNSNGTFPMLLDELKVVAGKIGPNENESE